MNVGFKWRRKFPDRNLAKQILGKWMPIGSCVTVKYGFHWIEQATMTNDGIIFHNGFNPKLKLKVNRWIRKKE